MAVRDPLIVRLDAFEGPLDLLLYLIQSHELDISRVSVGAVTDQYLRTIKWMQELNFDVASDFLVMAATLIYWKSKALLPRDEADASANEEDDGILSQDEIIRRLRQLQEFRRKGAELASRPRLGEHVFIRPPEKPPVEKIWKEMSITSMALSFQEMLTRARRRGKILKKETVSISRKIEEFAHRLTVGQREELRALMALNPDRPEIVVTFLASIELSKHQHMRLMQEGTYQPIYVELLHALDRLNLGLVSEFEKPEPAEAAEETENTTAPEAGILA